MALGSYLLASSYAGLSPLSSAAAVCSINGQVTQCPNIGPIFAAIFGLFWVVWLAVVLVYVVSLWKIFVKAGKPGWAILIPIYNAVVVLEITGRPIWWIFFYFIPVVNIIVSFVVLYDFCRSFGKDAGFFIGTIFLPFIFMPILAFGDATYRGPVARS